MSGTTELQAALKLLKFSLTRNIDKWYEQLADKITSNAIPYTLDGSGTPKVGEIRYAARTPTIGDPRLYSMSYWDGSNWVAVAGASIAPAFGTLTATISVLTPILDTPNSTPLQIGPTTTSSITIGRAGIVTNVLNQLKEAGSRVWTASTLTNLNQLTNGPGYISGISGSDVTTALGYTPLKNVTDTLTGTLTINAASVTNALSIVDGTEKAYITKTGVLYAFGVNVPTGGPYGVQTDYVTATTTNTSLRLRGIAQDGSGAVGVALDNTPALSITGAKLVSFRNNQVEKAYIDKDGGFSFGASITGNGTTGRVYASYAQAGRFESNTGGIGEWYGTIVNADNAIAWKLNTQSTLSNTGTKLLSIQNNTVEKAYIDKDGVGGFPFLHIDGIPNSNIAAKIKIVTPIATTVEIMDIGEGSRGAGLRVAENGGGDVQLSLTTRGVNTITERLTVWSNFVANTHRVGINKIDPSAALHAISQDVDGVSAIASIIDTSTAWSSGNLLSIRNNNVEQVSVNKDGLITSTNGGFNTSASVKSQFYYAANSGLPVNIYGQRPDGANTAVVINNSVSLTNASAKLLSIQNATVEKAYIDKDGNIGFPAAASIVAGTTDGANRNLSILGAPSNQANAVGVVIGLGGGTTGTDDQSGQKIASFKVNSSGVLTEKAYVDRHGALVLGIGEAGTATTFGTTTGFWNFVSPYAATMTVTSNQAGQQARYIAVAPNAKSATFEMNETRARIMTTPAMPLYIGVGDGASSTSTKLMMLCPNTAADGDLVSTKSTPATVGSQLVDSPKFSWRGAYWDGAASVDYDASIRHSPYGVANSNLIFAIGGNDRFYMNHAGRITISPGVDDTWIAFSGDTTGYTKLRNQHASDLLFIDDSGQGAPAVWKTNSPYRMGIGFINSSSPTLAAALHVRSTDAGGASDVASIIDTSTAWSTTGAKLLSLRNNGTEWFSVDLGGATYIGHPSQNAYGQHLTVRAHNDNGYAAYIANLGGGAGAIGALRLEAGSGRPALSVVGDVILNVNKSLILDDSIWTNDASVRGNGSFHQIGRVTDSSTAIVHRISNDVPASVHYLSDPGARLLTVVNYDKEILGVTPTHVVAPNISFPFDDDSTIPAGTYREVTGGVFPTAIIWWTNAGKTVKVKEKLITRAADQTPTTIVFKFYSGGNLISTATDTITYSGVTETSRTRAIT